MVEGARERSTLGNEEFSNYPEQVAFEEVLARLWLFDFTSYGPKSGEFLKMLATNRLAVDGIELVRADGIPDPFLGPLSDDFRRTHQLFQASNV